MNRDELVSLIQAAICELFDNPVHLRQVRSLGAGKGVEIVGHEVYVRRIAENIADALATGGRDVRAELRAEYRDILE